MVSATHLPEILNGKLESIPAVAFRRTGKRPSPPTCWRWHRIGVGGGIKLQVVRHSGKWLTTEAAFDQFIADQTAAALGENAPEEDDTSDADLIAAGLL